MRQQLLPGTVIAMLLVPVALHAQEPRVVTDEGPERLLIYRPGEIEWSAGPASLAAGAEFSVLEGDPGEPGVFTMRIRMPDGFVIAPHSHVGVERVTVLSGTFHLGSGDVVDREATTRLPAGSHFSLPPGMRHFAIMDGETIIQLSSIGPWQIDYVNPADDPRRSSR